MSKSKIVKYRQGHEKMIYRLIRKVYDEYVAIDYSDEGNKFFYDWIQPSKIAERQQKQNNIWVVFENEELVGIIEIRDNKNISLLFVAKEYQGRGIARSLFNESLKEIIKIEPNLDKFYVHASPYSIPFYRKMGFIETDNMLEENGIIFLPMEMTINK